MSTFDEGFFVRFSCICVMIYMLHNLATYDVRGIFCMGEVHYMISEAAKRVSVETHVLRYWEEELALDIGRTEMGHRYYTEEDVQLFHCIKELKEQGMLLKDLKNLIPDMLRTKEQLKQLKQRNAQAAADKTDSVTLSPKTPLQEALLENNKVLEQTISLAVSKAVVTEIDFLLQAKERQEEERYKKLDTLIRQQQNLRRESARSIPFKGLKRFLEYSS